MQTSTAVVLIRRSLEGMNALYEGMVFDEWAVVALPAKGTTLVAYHGPRAEEFRRTFLSDIAPLSTELSGSNLPVGGFAFATSAEGTNFDACVRVGTHAYLLCNHTARTMEEIRANPRWLHAQKPFVELAEAFTADPLA
jgi:hypothetical protein